MRLYHALESFYSALNSPPLPQTLKPLRHTHHRLVDTHLLVVHIHRSKQLQGVRIHGGGRDCVTFSVVTTRLANLPCPALPCPLPFPPSPLQTRRSSSSNTSPSTAPLPVAAFPATRRRSSSSRSRPQTHRGLRRCATSSPAQYSSYASTAARFYCRASSSATRATTIRWNSAFGSNSYHRFCPRLSSGSRFRPSTRTVRETMGKHRTFTAT